MHDVERTVMPDVARDRERAEGVGRSPMAQIIAQQAAIAHIGQLALQETSLQSLLDEACVLVGRVLETEFVSVSELAPDGSSLTVVAGTGWRPGIVGSLTLGAGGGSQSGYTIASCGPVIVDDTDQESRFTVTAVLLEHGVRSGMSVRIGSADKPFGTLAAFTQHRGRFTRDDANFLHAVANVLAAAVTRLTIEHELRASRDQLAAIVSSIDEGITVQGPGGLAFANDEAARITGLASAEELVNATAEVLQRFEIFDENGQLMPPDELPGRRAMRGEERPEALVGFRVKASGDTRWSMVRAVGLTDASGKVSSVINIFREVTDERWNQEARAYMADAIAVLSSTLQVEEAARRLVELSVPRLADYCTVVLRQPGGALDIVALAHSNPERLELARSIRERLPIDPQAPAGVARVVREGVIEQGEVTPEILEAAPVPGDVKEMLRRLEMRSYLSVPLTGRDQPIGALSLVMAESGRTLGERERRLAEELGVRAGIALENARLYQTAEARRAELDAVLAALAEGVLVFDARGALRMANQSAIDTFAGDMPQTLDELRARVSSEVSAGYERTAEGDSAVTAVADGEPVEVQFDRRGQWLEVRRYRARAGDASSADMDTPTVVVLRDVTEVRAARAARDAFMGVLSHELRTPITTIYGGSELLERGLDDDGRREVLADIRAESERLVRLVEDLLVMTRVERGIVEIADEPILLQHLLAEVIESVGSRYPGARIELRASQRVPAVRGDATYIEQVVRNLLTNAMRYGDGQTRGIDVLIEPEERFVSVRVQDNGRGFDGEDPEQLFQLFYRSASARSVPGGAGIGLFVCRNLIEKMGGRVWAAERAQGGAEFGFTLPMLEMEAGA